MLSRAGNRIAAIAALLSAVPVAPAPRRLPGAYGAAGGRAGAPAECERLVGRPGARGACDGAVLGRPYGAAVLAPRAIRPTAIAAPRRQLPADQSVAIRRLGVAVM